MLIITVQGGCDGSGVVAEGIYEATVRPGEICSRGLEEKLAMLNSFVVERRRLRGDIIKAHKITYGLDRGNKIYFPLAERLRTKEHNVIANGRGLEH